MCSRNAEAAREGHANARFEARDLSRFDQEAEHAAFDLVTSFDAIHDQAQPLAVLRGIRRSLAEGGVYLAQDVKGSTHHHLNRDHPLGTLLYTISCMHCMDRVAGAGRRGPGRDVGPRDRRALLPRGRIHYGGGP